MVIQRGCRTLIEHLQSYAWDPKAADRGEDRPLKINDHIVDALRYAVASTFPYGELNHPDENITIEQLRHKVYEDRQDLLGINQGQGGYF